MEKQNLIILTNRVGLQQKDALSLSHLSSNTLDPNLLFQSSPSPQAFIFSGDQMEESLLSIDSILFCGRSIPFEKPRNFRAAYKGQSLLTSDTDHSFKRQFSLRRDSTGTGAWSNSPGRITSSKASLAPAGISRYGSGSPRKYKAIIGVTKFHSKMEMNDIKRRQSLQAPKPLVPAAFNGGEAVVTVATTGRRGGGHCHWGLLRPLRFTSQLVNALSRASLGCIPHV